MFVEKMFVVILFGLVYVVLIESVIVVNEFDVVCGFVRKVEGVLMLGEMWIVLS